MVEALCKPPALKASQHLHGPTLVIPQGLKDTHVRRADVK